MRGCPHVSMGLCEMIDDSTKLQTWEALAYEALGGEDVARALWRHHSEHESVRAIAQSFDLSEATLRTRMNRGRTVLRRLGLMPVAWDQPAMAQSHQGTS